MFAKTIANTFQMDDKTWKGHANPWCFWTRLTAFPLLCVAIWSRVWFGWWSLLPIATALLWIWLNARIFPQPKSTNNWISKGVFGERVWINREEIPIPQHHQKFPHLLTGFAFIGLILATWGLTTLDVCFTFTGNLIIYIGKLWFFDRMALLYEEMKDTNFTYKSWLY